MLNFIDDNDFLLVDSFTESGDGVVNWIYDEGEGKQKHSGAIFEGLTRTDEQGNSVDIWNKLLAAEASSILTIHRKTAEQIEAEQQELTIQNFRQSRQSQLNNAIVTTSSGTSYDANETSMIRMDMRIRRTRDEGGSDTTLIQWSTADVGTGVLVDVELADLEEALRLAQDNMQALWGINGAE